MTSFWSLWVSAITLIVVFGCAWLLWVTRKSETYKESTEETLGHEFDGIEEYDNPLPRWWMHLFIATIIFSIGYLALYPGLGNFQGLLGWSSAGQWEEEMAHAEKTYQPVFEKYASLSLEEAAADKAALQIGQRLFANNCAVCHGSAGTGAVGFPNLTDADWLYGSDPQSIKATISNGRMAMMPAWEAVLKEQGVTDVASYVLSLSGREVDQAAAARGESMFNSLCTGCHGPEAKGMPIMGAPNLTDNIWLYGGSFDKVVASIAKGRKGEMPAHKDLLSEEKIHLLTAYVYSLSK